MSSHRFATIKKSDPLFSQYLWGQGSDMGRPVPIETLNLGSPEETVTFEFLKKEQVTVVSPFMFFSHLIKLNSFTLILLPLFYVLSKNYIHDRFNDPFSVFLAALSMLFLYAGLNIRNDVVDHLSGFDRVNIPVSPKPILKGWITARRASRISWSLMILSFVIAFPIFILQSELIRVIAVVATLVILSQMVSKNSYKNNLLGEITLFILMGPALVSGYQVSLGAGIDTEVLAFGILWGTVSVFLIHVNNFSHLVTSAQARIKNSMTKMGFDRAKKFIILWWVVLLIFWELFLWYFMPRAYFGAAVGALIGCSFPFLRQINKVKSPLGSELRKIRVESNIIFLIISFILLIENIFAIETKLTWIH